MAGGPTPADVRAGSHPAYDPKTGGTSTTHGKAAGKNNTDRLSLGGMPPAMVRRVLVNHGYDVDPKGPMTLRLKAAMMNAEATNGAGSGKWNKRGPQRGDKLKMQGGAIVRVNPVDPAGHVVPDGKAPAGKTGPGAKPSAHPKPDPTPAPNGQDPLDSITAQGPAIPLPTADPRLALLNRSLAKKGASLLNADQYGEHQAALGFDSGISDAQHVIDKTQAQGAQNQQDIASWMHQVQASQGTAAKRDTAASAAGNASIDAASKAILSSLGGAANEGSSEVAGAAQNGANELAALGANEDQYNADLAPLLKSQQADMAHNEQAQNSQDVSDARQKLTDLVTQRGAAKATAADQATQMNNAIRDNQVSRLMQIVSANNGTRQQGFQNKLALAQTIAGIQANGMKAQASMVKALTSGHKGPKTFAAAGKSAHDDAFTTLSDGLSDGNKRSPNQVVQYIRNGLNQRGWSFHNQNVQALASSIAKQAGFTFDPRVWAPLQP